jgi:hypothetical protein
MTSKDLRHQRLTDLFFERFFYNDLISSEDDPQLDSANIMAMLVFPGMMTLYWVPKYYVTLARASESAFAVEVFGDRFFWMAFQMGLIALIATLQWERFYPEGRDYAILGPQPVKVADLFRAQVRALLRFLAVFFLLINGFAAIFFPIATVPYRAGLFEGLLFTAGHWFGLIACSATAVAFVGGLQGLLIVAVPARWRQRASTVLQSLLAAFFVLFIVAVPVLRARVLSGSDTLAELVASSSWLALLPPAWFAALGECAAGRHDGLLQPLAQKALFALASVVCLFIGVYLLTFRRFVARSLEGPRHDASRYAPLSAFVRRLAQGSSLRDPLQHAVFFFALRTLVRSAPQRLYVGGFLAVGGGVVFSQLWTATSRGDLGDVILQQPYILLFLVCAGMRKAFSIPADLAANWVFRFHQRPGAQRYLAGVRKALWMVGPLPLLLFSTVAVGSLLSPTLAFYRLPVFLAASWFTAEAVLWRLGKIPFTCRYLAGGAHVIILWTFCAVGMFLYGSWFAVAESWVFGDPWRSLPVALALPLLVRYARSPATTLRFEDPNPFIQPLRLS